MDLEEWNGIRREIIAANTSEGSGDGVGREYVYVVISALYVR